MLLPKTLRLFPHYPNGAKLIEARWRTFRYCPMKKDGSYTSLVFTSSWDQYFRALKADLISWIRS